MEAGAEAGHRRPLLSEQVQAQCRGVIYLEVMTSKTLYAAPPHLTERAVLETALRKQVYNFLEEML